MPTIREREDSISNREAKYRDWQEYQQSGTVEPFKDLLQRDPRVCDHCFLLRYEQVTMEWSQGELGWMPYEQFIPIQENERHEEIPPERVSSGMRLACGHCGHRNSKSRPLCKEDVQQISQNISQTLSEKGVAHDGRLLRHTIQRRNTSHNQGKQDSHVFAPAVRVALEAEHEDVKSVVERYLRSDGTDDDDDGHAVYVNSNEFK